jgi:choline dehydrogenase-like flavoprotein
VGAGAAGIPIALELDGSGLAVLVLEAGGRRFDAEAQDSYKGVLADGTRHGPLDEFRLRQFGGTTNVWGGRCAPFDAIDFASRDWVPHSGWPIQAAELEPFYRRAHSYCELGTPQYDARELADEIRPLVEGIESDDLTTNLLWRYSPPTNFRRRFWKEFQRSGDVTVLLHANCLRIALSPSGARVDELEVAGSPERRFVVQPRVTIVATGGLEATRLLLASDGVQTSGLGNTLGCLGRFYMSHMSGSVPDVRIDPTVLVHAGYDRATDRVYVRRRLAITEAAQRRLRLLNFSALLTNPDPADPAHKSGPLSAVAIGKAVRSEAVNLFHGCRIVYRKDLDPLREVILAKTPESRNHGMADAAKFVPSLPKIGARSTPVAMRTSPI